MNESFALFDTARGACGVVWTPEGITGVQLPERSSAATRVRIEERHAGAVEAVPGAAVARAVARITDHLNGKPRDLSSVALDMSRVTPFRARVYETLRAVKAGSTVSYVDLAAASGAPGAARAVGQAMASNPFPLVVPCHRVLAAGRRIGGFSAHGGAQTKVDLLALEGVTLPASALGLAFEPARAAAALATADPVLGALIERVGPLRLLVNPMESPFVALVKSIVYQQLTGKAAFTILSRLKARFEGRVPSPADLLAASDDDLRAVGLSRPKIAGLKDLAAKARQGVVPTLRALRALDDEAIVERLVSIRGIGRWSVEMLLIFRLGRPDVFPVDDYGMRKGLTYLVGAEDVVTPARAAEAGDRWRPYRTAAAWYLWRAAELGREAFEGWTGRDAGDRRRTRRRPAHR